MSSSCRASGQQMWLMAPAWLSTTSTDWWPLAVPGTCLLLSLCPYLCNTAMGRKLGRVFVGIRVLQRLIVVHVVCVRCENLPVCVFAEAYLVCACQKLLMDCAICQVGRNVSSSLLPCLLHHLFLQVSTFCTSLKHHGQTHSVTVLYVIIAITVLCRQ